MELVPKPVIIDFNKSPVNRNRNAKTEEWRKGQDSMPKRWTAILKTCLKNFPHDITFSVGGESISCHKFVLSVASPFFEDLVVAANEIGQNVIEVTGIDTAAFKNLVQHVYQDEKAIDEKDQDVATTMSAAHLCEIPELENLCAQNLQQTLSAKNAVSIFQEAMADRINNGQLRESAYGFILKNFDQIVNSEDFLRYTNRHLCEFLKTNDFYAPSEIVVFKSVIRWGEHQCKLQGKEKTKENLRGVLDGVLRHIRMRSISPADFKAVIVPSNLFVAEEANKLLLYFWDRKENKQTNVLLQELNISTHLRHIPEKTVDLFSEFTLYEEYDTSNFRGYNWGVRFNIDGDEGDPPVYLRGVALAGRPSKPTENITMKIRIGQHDLYQPNGPFLCEMETSYTAEANKTKMIDLNQPVKIVPNNKNHFLCICLTTGGVARWKNPKKDIVLYNETDGISKPIKLTLANANYVYSLKFSLSE